MESCTLVKVLPPKMIQVEIYEALTLLLAAHVTQVNHVKLRNSLLPMSVQ